MPVDRWGPKVAKRTDQAYQEIRSGIRALYELGNEVVSLREKESAGERLPQTKSAAGIRRKPQSYNNDATSHRLPPGPALHKPGGDISLA